MPPPLEVDLLTLRVVSESRVTWTTSVQIVFFLGLSVLDLGPMYMTDGRQTDRRQMRSSLNVPTLVAGHNNTVVEYLYWTGGQTNGHREMIEQCHAVYVCACSLCLHFNGHFPGGPGLAGARMSPFRILLELRMMEVVSGDNWSCKTCNASGKSSPPTNQHPVFLLVMLPVAQPIASEH